MQFDDYFELLLNQYDPERSLTPKKCELMASKLTEVFQCTPPPTKTKMIS